MPQLSTTEYTCDKCRRRFSSVAYTTQSTAPGSAPVTHAAAPMTQVGPSKTFCPGCIVRVPPAGPGTPLPQWHYTAGAAIRGVIGFTNAQKASAITLISQLTYADLWRPGAGTLYIDRSTNVRIDMQGVIASPPQQNIQVQLGTGSISHVNISHAFMGIGGAGGQRRFLRFVKHVFHLSLETGQSYSIH